MLLQSGSTTNAISPKESYQKALKFAWVLSIHIRDLVARVSGFGLTRDLDVRPRECLLSRKKMTSGWEGGGGVFWYEKVGDARHLA